MLTCFIATPSSTEDLVSVPPTLLVSFLSSKNVSGIYGWFGCNGIWVLLLAAVTTNLTESNKIFCAH